MSQQTPQRAPIVSKAEITILTTHQEKVALSLAIEALLRQLGLTSSKDLEENMEASLLQELKTIFADANKVMALSLVSEDMSAGPMLATMIERYKYLMALEADRQ